MDRTLTDKTAFITGGTKGIGLGIAEKMASEKMRIAVTGRHQDEIDAMQASLQKLGAVDVLGFKVDVRDGEGMNYAVQEILARWGQLDVVIANAGVGIFESIDKMTYEQWSETIDINLTGVFHTVKST